MTISNIDVSAEIDESTEHLIAAAKQRLTFLHSPQANGSLTFHQTKPFTDMYSGRRIVRVGVSYQLEVSA
jgi:hypothetical protein